MKKALLSVKVQILLLAAVCACVIGGSYAYFTDGDSAENEITVGGVTTEIVEEFPSPDPTPGGSFTKKVQIRSNGPSDCYVRVQILFSDDEMENICTLDYDRANWTEESDGWWYYKDVLKEGELTTPLFTKVTISSGATASDIHRFNIIVRQESRQSSGYENALAAFTD